MIWLTSDTHGYHCNIVRGCSEWIDKSRCRDFDTVEEMTETLIKGINDNVKQDDILWHLGDWTFGGEPNIKRFRDRIICNNIHLILGNHDHHIERNPQNYKDLFRSIDNYAERSLDKQRIVMLHYSMRVWNESHRGAWHLYGHSHSTLEGQPWGKSMDVGVDNAFRLLGEYRPFSLPEVKKIMGSREIAEVDHHNSKTN